MSHLPPAVRTARAPVLIGTVLAAIAWAHPSSSGPGAGSPKLDAALEAIELDAIKADVHYIASDEMGGRDTPSEGLKATARYLAARLERLGFAHGAQDGYLYPYPLESRMLDLANSGAAVLDGDKQTALEFGKDYFFFAREVATHELEGPVVYCGSASDAELAELELTGKWALCTEDSSTRSSSRERARTLQQRGALGVIVMPGSNYKGKPYEERFRPEIDRASRASVSYPQGNAAEGARKAVLPQVFMAKPAQRLRVDLSPPPKPGKLLDVRFREWRKLAGDGGLVQVENVCGFWPGDDPKLKHEVILISAHYDHVGTRSDGTIYNGADDNGSGTTTLLALAAALKAHGPLRRSVLLLWVSGEEKGLWGSQAWTESPWLPSGCKPVCNINIDMVGRNAGDKLLVTPSKDHQSYNGLTKLAESFASNEKFKPLGSADEYWERSDHVNFARNLKIPVCFLFSDVHADYHQPGDDPEKIDCDKIRRVARLVMRMLDGLQADELQL
jgi:hypothetical protein